MEETDNICFVCDKTISSEKWKYKLQVTATKKRKIPVADLINQLVGDDFAVLVGERDAVCSACMNLLNLMDGLTARLAEVQALLSQLLHAKYNLSSDTSQFEVAYDDSTLAELDPLLQCSSCSFATKYEKEYNIHVRTHTTTSLSTTTLTADPETFNEVTDKKKSPKTAKHSARKPRNISTRKLKSKAISPPTNPIKTRTSLRKKVIKASPKPKKKKVLFQCSACDKLFPSENSVRVHAKNDHGNDNIVVSDEDEYEDIQTLESSDEESIDEKTVPIKKVVSPDKKRKTPMVKRDILEDKQPKRSTVKRNTSATKRPRKGKDATYKLDFLSDWEEDEDNDEITSPAKKKKDDKKTEINKNVKGKRRMSSADNVENDEETLKPTCMFCHSKFSSMEAVQDHVKLSHGGKSGRLSAKHQMDTSPRCEIDSTTDFSEAAKGGAPTRKTFKCNFCGVRRVSEQFIGRHMKEHKNKVALQCKLCGTVCRNLFALKIHGSRCTKVTSVSKKCRHCKIRFFDANQLKVHIKKVHNKTNSKTRSRKGIKKNVIEREINYNLSQVSNKSKTKLQRNPQKVSNDVVKSVNANDRSKISVSEVSSTSLEADVNSIFETNVKDDKKHTSKPSGKAKKIDYQCEECGSSFNKAIHLEVHLNRHKSKLCSDLGICVFCGKLFIDQDQVTIHTNAMHSKGKCTFCTKTYINARDLKVHHMKTHFSKNTEELVKKMADYQLSSQLNSRGEDVYSKVFRELQHLTGEEAYTPHYSCPLCEFSSSDKQELNVHFLSHPKNYCNICQSIFSTTDAIKHIENHSIQFQNIKCSICTTSLHDDMHLQFHTASLHAGKKPFQCSMCKTSFLTKKQMLIHEQSEHCKKSKKTISCGKCKKDFYSEKEYKTHSEFAHRPSLNCKYCDKSVCDISKLALHERNHLKQATGRIYKCSVCGKVLKSQAALKIHKTNHTSSKDSLKCELCNKSFKTFHTLREHSANHSNVQEKKYFCDTCGKGFYFYDSHSRHRKLHLDPLLFQCKKCKERFETKQKLTQHREACSGTECKTCLATVPDLRAHVCLTGKTAL